MSNKKDDSIKTSIIPQFYIMRWKPDFHYCDDKLVEHKLSNFKSSEDSVTDKEAYRVTLASLRGELAQGSGSPTTGNYSIKAGQDYDPRFDFSYLNRPDISIVDLDNYIKDMRDSLEKADDNLRIQIQSELQKAEQKAEAMKQAELQKAEKTNDN